MPNEKENDRGHRLATWLQTEFSKLDAEQQAVCGQAMMLLFTESLTLPTENSPSGREWIPQTEPGDTPAPQVTQLSPGEHRFRRRADFVAYLERTDAPFRRFFEGERYSRGDLGTDSVDDDWPDGASRTLLRGALKRLQKLLTESTADAAVDTRDDVRRGILRREEALAMIDAYAVAPDPAATQGPDMLDAQAMADWLEVSQPTVEKRFSEGRMIGLEREDGSRVYPRTQFVIDDSSERRTWLPSMEQIVNDLGNGWAVWIWLNNARDEFDGQTALQRLQEGDGVAVRAALAREQDGAFS